MTHPARRTLVMALCVFSAVGILFAPQAAAHGDLASADPAEGAKLDKIPSEVLLTFTEPPAAGALLAVTDGCNTAVGGEPTIDEAALSASVATDDAQPGEWTMTYRFISDVDGHQSRGKLTFTVAGKPRCNDDKGENDVKLGANPTPLTREKTGKNDEGSNFPWAVVVGGGLVVIVGGLLLRRFV